MPLRAAPLAAIAAVLALWCSESSPSAQEIVTGRPPMYARLERTRVYLSPLTAVTMRLDLDGESAFASHRVDGIGLSFGADFILHRYAALWINGHAGAVTGAEARIAGRSARLSSVEGSFRSIAAGAAGVLSDNRWTGLFGLGVFTAGAEWEGRDADSHTFVDTSANLTGVVASLRGDYTLRNGFILGFGVDAGGGIAAGAAARGARNPIGDWLVFYIPMGWTY